MKQWKRTVGALCLTLLFCLSLTACGSKAPASGQSNQSSQTTTADTSEPITGADWTTWGIINDQKSLSRMGEQKEVYVCVYDDRVDLNETTGGTSPTLYAQLTYPETVSAAAKQYGSISFVDRNGDNQSDATLTLKQGDKTITWVWYWEEKTGFVYQSEPNKDHPEVSPYVGLWSYESEHRWLHIYDDATWSFVNSEDEVIDSGDVQADQDGVTLHYDGSGDTLRLDSAKSGDLLDGAKNGVLVPAEQITAEKP